MAFLWRIIRVPMLVMLLKDNIVRQKATVAHEMTDRTFCFYCYWKYVAILHRIHIDFQ